MKIKRPNFIYGTAWKKEKSRALTTLALENGFRAIDTANQPKHYTESLVGEAVGEFLKTSPRGALFLQTKFTPLDGQDHRIPYDAAASVGEQVKQSFLNSLEHLHTDHLDSYLLHGPYHFPGLGKEDWEVWSVFEELYREGKTKSIGISNVSARQLEELITRAKIAPMVVQNRCYANRGWDYEVREICRAQGILYEGFSLLTANPYVLQDEKVLEIAKRLNANPAQVVFRFSAAIGILPLTGTTNASHMKADLQALELPWDERDFQYLERIAFG